MSKMSNKKRSINGVKRKKVKYIEEPIIIEMS